MRLEGRECIQDRIRAIEIVTAVEKGDGVGWEKKTKKLQKPAVVIFVRQAKVASSVENELSSSFLGWRNGNWLGLGKSAGAHENERSSLFSLARNAAGG
jgi:hypothetical protein